MKLLVSSFLFLSVNAMAAGFLSGDKFSAVRLSGQAQVQCTDPQGQTSVALFSCTGSELEPTSLDYFMGPNVDADKVSLTVTFADGSKKNKTVNYNSNLGRSTDRINLWISTLTQRPLLSIGRNLVDWQLLKGNRAVTQGVFEVLVQSGRRVTCETRPYFSSDMNDCQSPYNICNRYLNEAICH